MRAPIVKPVVVLELVLPPRARRCPFTVRAPLVGAVESAAKVSAEPALVLPATSAEVTVRSAALGAAAPAVHE